MLRIALVIAALVCAGDAFAQTTSTTMDLGGGMTHTDTMGTNGSSTSTNCTNIGGGMATCNTIGTGTGPVAAQTQRGGSTTLSLIGGLIAQSQERSFQKKITQLVSNGDCLGAANLAFAKGRYEMSSQIRRSCATLPVPVPVPIGGNGVPSTAPNDLEAKLQLALTKVRALLPIAEDETTTIVKADVIGNQILLTAKVNADGMTISEPGRIKVQDEICASASPPVLKAGASVRIKYFEPSGKEIGSVMVTRSECGL